MHRQRKDDDPQHQIRAVEAEVEVCRIEAMSRYRNQPCFLGWGALERCDETDDEKPSDFEDSNNGGAETELRCSKCLSVE